MRNVYWIVVAVIVCHAQSVTAQTVRPCGPVALQPTAISTPSAYFSSTPAVGNTPVPPAPAITSYYPVGAPQVAYPPYTVYRPVLPVARMPASYYVGPGVLGQPKLYVPGQPVRNLLRYLSP